MRRFGLFLASPLLALVSVAFAQAPSVSEAPANAPGAVTRTVVLGDHDRVEAWVDAIDYAGRTVTLKTDSGSVTLQVGPEAKNFDKVKVGDKVTADYYKAMAVYVRRVDEPSSINESTAVKYAAPGAQPGGVIVATKEITARVDSVDLKTRMATLTGPGGRSVTIKVDDAVQNLDRIKAGDQVVMRYAEAFALSVNKN